MFHTCASLLVDQYYIIQKYREDVCIEIKLNYVFQIQ